jgi:hypothetical protein
MSELIEEEKEVLDLGCGRMWLRDYLPPNARYWGCDYVKRDHNTIVCDFNQREFPAKRVDLMFISGCLEYVQDVDWFLENVARNCSSLILSYCTLELNPSPTVRNSLGWKSHLSLSGLLAKLLSKGFVLSRIMADVDGNVILKLRKVSGGTRQSAAHPDDYRQS